VITIDEPVVCATGLVFSEDGQNARCTCNGFRLHGYMFLNDATCPDGAQEYARHCGVGGQSAFGVVADAVIKESSGIQVESTISSVA